MITQINAQGLKISKQWQRGHGTSVANLSKPWSHHPPPPHPGSSSSSNSLAVSGQYWLSWPRARRTTANRWTHGDGLQLECRLGPTSGVPPLCAPRPPYAGLSLVHLSLPVIFAPYTSVAPQVRSDLSPSRLGHAMAFSSLYCFNGFDVTSHSSSRLLARSCWQQITNVLSHFLL